MSNWKYFSVLFIVLYLFCYFLYSLDEHMQNNSIKSKEQAEIRSAKRKIEYENEKKEIFQMGVRDGKLKIQPAVFVSPHYLDYRNGYAEGFQK